jgi:hypothetical protein
MAEVVTPGTTFDYFIMRITQEGRMCSCDGVRMSLTLPRR